MKGLSMNKPAFSLIEMLMALLVASLLLAALAPVMTRRMADHELKVMSEASNYDKDSIITIFNDSSETQEFNIPNDTNRITVTMMGGGGAGGDALYGNKIFTSNETFTVPDGVTKLRVFMVGGGGGGASGGVGEGVAYGSLTGTAGQQEYAGNTSANTGTKTWTIPLSAKGNVPNVDYKCIRTNPNSTWTLVSDTSKTVETGDTIVNVKACGGGGGGSTDGGIGGGSGGYTNKQVTIPRNINNISITIGGGGGGGSNNDCTNGFGSSPQGWGGGGGGTEYSSIRTIAGIYPGGTGAFIYTNCIPNGGIKATNASGTAGSPGGPGAKGSYSCFIGSGNGSLEGGGGGGGASPWGGGGGGGGATFFGRYGNSADTEFFLVAAGGGGGCSGGCSSSSSNGSSGGGGGGGLGGGAGTGKAGAGGNDGAVCQSNSSCAGGTSPIGNANYCAGGLTGQNHTGVSTPGRNGYMLISWAPVANILKCNYSIPSNGGGGGGAGQIWIGEINVTPGQKLSFNIGAGGAVQTLAASNGNDGTATSITASGTTLASVSGGRGGKYESDESYIAATGGLGGGIRTNNLSSFAKYNNWTKNNYTNGGTQGGQGYLESDAQNGAGGYGGTSYKLDGTVLPGGASGGTSAEGGNAISTNYGTGGGGGGGGANGSFGTGGKGANGYIYVEWGGSNGGGGTVGEFTQKVLTNFEQNDRKMVINIGKGGEGSVNGGIGGNTTVAVKSGGKNVTLTARGGIKGENGTMDLGVHGGEVKYPDSYSELYKEYVQGNLNIVMGQKADESYGGMGGYLACLYNSQDEEGNKVCNQSIKSNDGLDTSLGPVKPGCGGTSLTSSSLGSDCFPYSTIANPNGGNGMFGAGGGGGAVLERMGGKGGKGGDGFVILEYKSVQ